MRTKKLLGIVGSYRKSGNSEIVAKAVGAKMGDGWELALISLPRLKIDPCKGCYVCLLPGRACTIKDDVAWLLECVMEADALIFTAPNYVLGPVAMVKMLADRALQATDIMAALGKTKTAVALTLGREDYRGYADTALAAQVRILGLNVASLEHFYGTHPGEVALAEDFEDKIAKLAESLTSDAYRHDVSPSRCPQCFSDLFRLRDEYLECAVCRSKALLQSTELHFTEFGTQFTDEGRQEHAKWLVMKKLEYSKIRDELKKVQNKYHGGRWLSPA
jgi:multimeric flavodoxin WrbA